MLGVFHTLWVCIWFVGKRIHYSDQNIHCTKPLHSCKHLSFKLGHFLCLPKARKTTAAQDPSTANRQIMLQRERKLSKAIAVVISAFLLCSVPWYIVQFLMYFCTPCSPHLRLLLLGHAVTAALLYANSGVNPFLYAWRLPRYRETFKHFWKKCQERCFSQNSQNENFVCETRL